jgi:hypothetical protein
MLNDGKTLQIRLILPPIGYPYFARINVFGLVALSQTQLECRTETTRFAGRSIRHDLYKPMGVNMQSSFLVLMLLAAGCAPVAPQLDSRFGASVRSLMAQQALPPTARAGGDAFDAAAAHGALSQYRQSFQAPAPVPQASFGTAGGASAGK